MLCDCLLGAVELTKITELDQYGYSVYNIEFDGHSKFSLSNDWWVKGLWNHIYCFWEIFQEILQFIAWKSQIE